MTGSGTYRVAPPGFSREQWQEFAERDRLLSDPDWLATLNREQRIIMRSYPHPHDYTNPSADDFPLFLDRETGADTDAGVPDRIPLRLRKRRTAAERFTTERGGHR